MQSTSRKYIIAPISIFGAIVLGIGGYFVLHKNTPAPQEPAKVVVDTSPKHEVIGTSVEGRSIEAYTYGTGSTTLLFVGGMHGGYEWNSALLAYEFMDYLDAHPDLIPDIFTVTVVPDANPDGTFAVVGKEGRFALTDIPTTKHPVGFGRLNAHDVDINRNFDCNWKPTSMWQSKTVSAGTQPFSEPEAQALRDFVLKIKPAGVVFWHSQANTVYASKCNGDIIPTTLDIMSAYAKAAGYNAVKSFDAYPITGDAEGWLASIGIPAITVELKTHETIEWNKNIAGIKALFKYYGVVQNKQ